MSNPLETVLCRVRAAPHALHRAALAGLQSVQDEQVQPGPDATPEGACGCPHASHELTSGGFPRVHSGQFQALEVPVAPGRPISMYVPVLIRALLLGSPVLSMTTAAARSSSEMGILLLSTAWHRAWMAFMRAQAVRNGRLERPRGRASHTGPSRERGSVGSQSPHQNPCRNHAGLVGSPGLFMADGAAGLTCSG